MLSMFDVTLSNFFKYNVTDRLMVVGNQQDINRTDL